jgi:hypothetical protein
MVIVDCGFFAYCLNLIGSIFQNMEKEQSELK